MDYDQNSQRNTKNPQKPIKSYMNFNNPNPTSQYNGSNPGS